MPSPTATPQPLLTATRSTFEALALLLAEPLPAPAGAPRAAALGSAPRAARVAFSGVAPLGGRPERAEGALHVAVSADVAAALAANMLGVAHAGPAECGDAVGELANVVCGNVLPLLAGPQAVFSLGAPEPLPAGATDGAAPAGAVRHEVWFDVEGGRAHVVLDAPAALFGAGAPAAAG